MKKILILVLALTMMSCAQPPRKNIQQEVFQSDIRTGLNVVIDYVSDEKRTFVLINIDNPNGKQIDLWFTHYNSVIGQKTMSSKRFYTGNHRSFEKSFRLPVSEVGITETIQVDVFDSGGALLMKTEPIVNSH